MYFIFLIFKKCQQEIKTHINKSFLITMKRSFIILQGFFFPPSFCCIYKVGFAFLVLDFKFKLSHWLVSFHLPRFTLSFESLICKCGVYGNFLTRLLLAEHPSHGRLETTTMTSLSNIPKRLFVNTPHRTHRTETKCLLETFYDFPYWKHSSLDSSMILKGISFFLPEIGCLLMLPSHCQAVIMLQSHAFGILCISIYFPSCRSHLFLQLQPSFLEREL